MKNINFSLSFMKKLRNAEHFDFYETIFSYIVKKELKPDTLLPLWNIFRKVFEKEDIIYKSFPKQKNTQLVAEAHKKRKKAYIGFKLMLESATYSDVQQVKEAAEQLMNSMRNYPHIYRAPMTEASAMISNLVQDLKLPRYASAVALVGVAKAIDRLQEDNKSFMTLFADRAYNEEEKKILGSLYQTRLWVDREFSNLCNVINTLYHINRMKSPRDAEVEEILSDVIVFVNSYIHQYKMIYARRNPKYQPGKNDDWVLPDGKEASNFSLPLILVKE
ncbi:MAG: DUF6261 family protein [Tannerellaceae bacterium]|jgi:hypothetical protein|nr:DUF6261 family protein [Tannerellaceae bacterium]